MTNVGVGASDGEKPVRAAERRPAPKPVPGEPPHTIYGSAWAAAQLALAAPAHGADGGETQRQLLRDLVTRFEAGWEFVRPILQYAEHHGAETDANPVFDFAVETAEFFREMAEDACGWIIDPGSAGAHETESMVWEMERFATHVAVLEMATRGVPGDRLVAALHQLAREVPAWCDAITTTVSSLGDLWDIPADPIDAEPPT